MKTLICRHCGCSLVRLGISKDQSIPLRHGDQEHYFCCQGCADLFAAAPERHLQRTNDIVVCPTCLAEKTRQWAFTFEHEGQEIHYCGCPSCREVFQKDPDHYIQRLEGTIRSQEVLGHDGGSVKPQ